MITSMDPRVTSSEPSSASHGRATAADIADRHERERLEIVGGEIVSKASPTESHGEAQANVLQVLSPAYRRTPGGQWPGGWRFATEVDIEFAPHEIYRPDVSGWRRERLAAAVTTFPMQVIPDWTYEVLSSNQSHDLYTKLRTYHRAAVPHYWTADPSNQVLSVYRWHADGYLLVLQAGRRERVRAEPFEALEWNVGALFGDDLESTLISDR